VVAVTLLLTLLGSILAVIRAWELFSEWVDS
jgi:hypothetical protein